MKINYCIYNLVLFTLISLSIGCASLFHSGPVAEVTGSKVNKLRTDIDTVEAGNSVAVERGSNVQAVATTTIQGDGLAMAINEALPWIASAFIIACIVFMGQTADCDIWISLNTEKTKKKAIEKEIKCEIQKKKLDLKAHQSTPTITA